MDVTQRLLLGLLGRALFGTDNGACALHCDWAALYQEARSQSVHLMVFDCLTDAERADMPPNVFQQWQHAALTTLWWNEQVALEQQHVLQALEENQIPCVILKGSSSALCYPKPELRVAGDIDLLLPKKHIQDAEHCLHRLGYAAPPGQPLHHCHRALYKKSFAVELHWEPNRLPDGAIGQELRHYFQDAMQHPQYVGGLPILAPCPRALTLLLHKLNHIMRSGLGLRHLCDWAAFVHAEMTPALWDELCPLLRRTGLLFFTQVITRICIDSLFLPKSDATWCLSADSDLCRNLLDHILYYGNFGRKVNTHGQHLFITTGSSNKLIGVCKNVFERCRLHWPACKTHPILLPIAPFYLLARQIHLRHSENYPSFHPLRVMRSARQHQKLNESLRPFLPENESEQ